MKEQHSRRGIGFIYGALLVGACVGILAGPLVGLVQLREVELLKSSFEDRKREVTGLNEQIGGLDGQIESQRKQSALLKKEIEEMQQKRAQFGKEGDLETEIARLTVEFDANTKKNERVTADLDAGKKDLADLGKQVDSARGILAGLDKNIETARGQLAGLQDALSKTNSDLQTAITDFGGKQRELMSLQADEKDTKSRLEKTNQDLDKATKELDRALKQLEKEKPEAERVTQELAALNLKNDEAKIRAKTLADSEVEASKQLTTIQTQFQEYQTRLVPLQQSVVKTAEDVKAGIAELDKTAAQRTKMQGEVADAEKQLATAKSELDSLKKSSDQLTIDKSKVQEAVTKLEARELELTKELDLNNKELADLLNRVVKAADDLKVGIAETNKTAAQRMKMQGDVVDAEKQLAAINGELDSLKKSSGQLTIDKSRVQEAVSRLEARQLELTQELELKNKELADILKRTAKAKAEATPDVPQPKSTDGATEADKPKPPSDNDGNTNK